MHLPIFKGAELAKQFMPGSTKAIFTECSNSYMTQNEMFTIVPVTYALEFEFSSAFNAGQFSETLLEQMYVVTIKTVSMIYQDKVMPPIPYKQVASVDLSGNFFQVQTGLKNWYPS